MPDNLPSWKACLILFFTLAPVAIQMIFDPRAAVVYSLVAVGIGALVVLLWLPTWWSERLGKRQDPDAYRGWRPGK
jgi:hypothetical protein